MTQRQRLKTMFESCANQWIPLYRILDMHIAQYGARVKELRDSGMTIENRTEWVNGVQHSWFRYVKQEVEANGQLVF